MFEKLENLIIFYVLRIKFSVKSYIVRTTIELYKLVDLSKIFACLKK
jgi:hypothetical protein